jgi:glycosyltransferase involved in cell wall biosynthesis
MKQPVILQVLPELRTGGVERGTVEIAGAIKRAGWQPLVASQGGAMVANVSYVGGEHIALPLASKNPFRIWRNAAALEKTIRERKVDLIHARSRAPAWSAWLAAKRTGTPFVTTFHGVYGLKPAIKKYYNAVMTRGDRVIAISHFVARHIAQHYHVGEDRLRIIHRGVDLNQFDPERIMPQRMIELARKWRVPDDLPLIVMPGRITRWKGQHVMVEALARLPHRHFFCLLVGDDMGHPNYRKEVEQSIRALGLEGHIRFAGNTPYMAEAYMLADIVVAPSVEPEAFGRVPVEAQAMGRLVIAANHGGTCETIVDGQTGWLVKPGNAGDLARAIECALRLPEPEKDRIRRQAIAHAREYFSAEIMCGKTLEVYWELIGKRYE